MQAVGTCEELEILRDGKLAVERKLLGDIADFSTSLGASVTQVHSGHLQGSTCRSEQAANHAESCGLAGTIRAKQAEHLSLANFEGYTIDRSELTELRHQIAHLDNNFPVTQSGYCVLGFNRRPNFQVWRCAGAGFIGL